MSICRMLIVLLLGLFSITFAREPNVDDDNKDALQNAAFTDMYAVSPEIVSDTLITYVFWDYILVHSNLKESRPITLKELPFSDYYKISVIAAYSESQYYEDKEEYQFVVNDTLRGVFDENGDFSTVKCRSSQEVQLLFNHNFHYNKFASGFNRSIRIIANQRSITAERI